MRSAAGVGTVLVLALSACGGGGGESAEPTTAGASATVEFPVEPVVAGDVLAPLEIDWTEVYSSDGEASIGDLVSTDHGIYAIGTARPHGPRVLFRSLDGMTWIESDVDDMFGVGASVEAIAATDSGALAIGAIVSDQRVELMTWTTTDGTLWSRRPLGPVLDQPTSDYESLAIDVETAVSPRGTLLYIEATTDLVWDPIEAAIAAEVPEGLDITSRDSANTVLGPGDAIVVTSGPLVVYRSRLGDLGLDDEMIAATVRSMTDSDERRQRFIFFSTDLATWSERDAADAFDPPGLATDVTGGDGVFVASVFTGWGTDVYASTDGTAWQRADAPSDMHGVVAHDGQVLGIVSGPNATTIWTSDDGLTWRRDDRFAGSDFPDSMYGLTSGGLGLFGVGEDHEDAAWDPENEPATVIDHDGLTLRMTFGVDGLTVTDATGAVVFSRSLLAQTGPQFAPIPEMSFDYSGRTMTIVDDGEELISVTFDELEAAWAAALDAAGVGHPMLPPTQLLWMPTSGGSWTTDTLDDIDDESWVSSLVTTVDALILTAEPADGGFQLWYGFPVASSTGGATERGTVSVAVSGLTDHVGDQLSGVLLSESRGGGTGVAGFAVTVDADPYSEVVLLGNVTSEWEETGLWPWPTGVAQIPPGTYILRLAIGSDYCCYSRWMPAETVDLQLCDVAVTTDGTDTTIEITSMPERGRCTTT